MIITHTYRIIHYVNDLSKLESKIICLMAIKLILFKLGFQIQYFYCSFYILIFSYDSHNPTQYFQLLILIFFHHFSQFLFILIILLHMIFCILKIFILKMDFIWFYWIQINQGLIFMSLFFIHLQFPLSLKAAFT